MYNALVRCFLIDWWDVDKSLNHWMNIGLRKYRVAPPNTVMMAKLSHSMASTLPWRYFTQETWTMVATIATLVARRMGSWVHGKLEAWSARQALLLPLLKSLKVTKNRMTGNRSNSSFIIIFYPKRVVKGSEATLSDYRRIHSLSRRRERGRVRGVMQ